MVALAVLACALALAAVAIAARRHRRAGGPPVRSELLVVGTTVRTFLYTAPAALAPGAPLLIVFHGGSGTPGQIRRGTGFGFDALAAADGFAVAYPQGIGGNWNTCQKGRKNAATRQNVDDVGFTQSLIAWFAARYQIDRARVFVAGFSNGGHMCFRLALEIPEHIAGCAAIAANRAAPADSRCPPHNMLVPMMLINGTADPINPYLGGELSPYGLRKLGPVLSTLDTAASFARPDAACHVTGARTHDSARTWVEKRTWASGAADDVVLFTIHGGGHTIPQPHYRFSRLFGATSIELDAPREIWRFFCAVSRAGKQAPPPTNETEYAHAIECRDQAL